MLNTGSLIERRNTLGLTSVGQTNFSGLQFICIRKEQENGLKVSVLMVEEMDLEI